MAIIARVLMFGSAPVFSLALASGSPAGPMKWVDICQQTGVREPVHDRAFIDVGAIMLIAPTRKRDCTRLELLGGRVLYVRHTVNEVVCKKHNCD